jgi:hypothetical protein
VVSLLSLQVRVAKMMGGGASWERVEREVIDPSPLDPDQKAALWLYGWSFLGQQEQRSEAMRYIAATQNSADDPELDADAVNSPSAGRRPGEPRARRRHRTATRQRARRGGRTLHG